jgi:hypothetical protein
MTYELYFLIGIMIAAIANMFGGRDYSFNQEVAFYFFVAIFWPLYLGMLLLLRLILGSDDAN